MRSAPGRNRAMLVAAILASLALQPMAVFATGAAEAGDSPEDRIRAGFVYNFCKFVQWPPPPLQEVPLVVLTGEIAPDFSSLQGKAVREAPIDVRLATDPAVPEDCRVLYVTAEQAANWDLIHADLDGAAVLTVSEMTDFCERGGMIQLVERQGRLRFHINRRAAESAGLVVSSQLLKMARIVESRD